MTVVLFSPLCQTRLNIESTVEKIQSCCGGGEGLAAAGRTSLTLKQLQDFKTVSELFRTTCFNWHQTEVNIVPTLPLSASNQTLHHGQLSGFRVLFTELQ